MNMDHFVITMCFSKCASPDDRTNSEHGDLCLLLLVFSAQQVSSSKLTKELL